MTSSLSRLLLVLVGAAALPCAAHADSAYDRVFRTPIGSNQNGLRVSVGGSGYGGSTVGRFNGISQRGASVHVQQHGQTTFSLPTSVANHNNLSAGTQGNVTIERVDSGSVARFTITSK